MDSSLFWCIVGIIGGGIISFLISYHFYFKGLSRKRLTYDITTFPIISNKINQIEGLEVKYNSVEIENLYSSTITIKNIGNSVVKEQDLAPLCPISISTSGQFLNPNNWTIESHPVNKITNYRLSFLKDKNAYNNIKFDFDYIPKKAIITFSLFHTGDIIFNGNLMEGEIVTPNNNEKHQKILSIISFVMCIIGLISTILSLYMYIST